MKKILVSLLVVFAAAFVFLNPVFGSPQIEPAEALQKVATGGAVLIDVREPSEWSGGVVSGALLLPLSDLKGPRALWAKELETAKGKELVLYCRSGNRSRIAGAILEKEGWKVWNAGGYSSMAKASAKSGEGIRQE
jgi:rhodanese-related sulfurtransferase